MSETGPRHGSWMRGHPKRELHPPRSSSGPGGDGTLHARPLPGVTGAVELLGAGRRAALLPGLRAGRRLEFVRVPRALARLQRGAALPRHSVQHEGRRRRPAAVRLVHALTNGGAIAAARRLRHAGPAARARRLLDPRGTGGGRRRERPAVAERVVHARHEGSHARGRDAGRRGRIRRRRRCRRCALGRRWDGRRGAGRCGDRDRRGGGAFGWLASVRRSTAHERCSEPERGVRWCRLILVGLSPASAGARPWAW